MTEGIVGIGERVSKSLRLKMGGAKINRASVALGEVGISVIAPTAATAPTATMG